ncbi:MAG: ATP-binding protein [Thermodesulfobacteriota bacterium]
MVTLPPPSNRLVGKALHDYRLLADGDRVMLAVSGGIDSLVLCHLLTHWRHKAPIHYDLLAVHLDMGFGSGEADLVAAQLERTGLPFLVERTTFGREALAAEDGRSGCYHCARQRRNRLFALAKEHGCNKLAFGHHQEDLTETFFLNLLYAGNLSTMVPRQELFGGNLALIRPLAYLDKAQVRELGELFGVTPVTNPCPLAGDSKRETVRRLLASLYAENPRFKANIFAALGHVRPEYLLRPLNKGDADRA